MVDRNRRDRIAAAYRPGFRADSTFAPEASSSTQYGYHGPAVDIGIVVRVDLNGYSKWAADKEIADRVTLLDDFFTKIVPVLEASGGVFFRDEGDCIVGLFSPYFSGGQLTLKGVLDFARTAVKGTYGREQLSAKVVIANDTKVAIFQKRHEIGTADWSAEGSPFVETARIEAAIPSKPRIYMTSSSYDYVYEKQIPNAPPGGRYYWRVERENLQVPGLGYAGGWVELVYLEHIPGGAPAT